MRVIDITSERSVELWPGRKLLARGDLVSLPRGAMSLSTGTSKSSLAFGSATKTTVMITGRPPMIQTIFDAVLVAERPEGYKTIT